ncbi:MAG TPA: radical SAM protein [Elusimicrobia bacterium]|nr:radical SAM protein [Elusimicrobiota bacterium]
MKVKPFYQPPSLLFRQAQSVLNFARLIKWEKLPSWLFNSGFKCLPVANGSLGMGCIGYPFHPVWEMTTGCNLKCIHCHASAGRRRPDELTTEEGKKLIAEIAKIEEFRMLVFTGGEPLVRPDLFTLLAYGQSLGFNLMIATNGTLIDEKMAKELKRYGVVGLAISFDHPDCKVQNYIRGKEDAFELALRGIRACRKAGLALQMNVTAMQYNFSALSEIVDFAEKEKSDILLMYQLVPVGRGKNLQDVVLNRKENEKLLTFLSQKQRKIRTTIEPVAGPQYWAYLLSQNGKNNGTYLKRVEKVFYGCTAGSGIVYIKPNGEVWPCPFLEIPAGNVREKPFSEIWRTSPLFNNLRRKKETLKGRCGICEYRTICGGCRGRAYAYAGDYLAEDPSCFLR